VTRTAPHYADFTNTKTVLTSKDTHHIGIIRKSESGLCRRRHNPFHVVKLAGDALDSVRRQVWQSARRYPDKRIAAKFKGARWALLKNPQDLTEVQAITLKALRTDGGVLWRAYQLKESLRAVFAGDLPNVDVMELLDRWCSRAQRSRIPEFVKTAATIRKNKAGITAAIERQLSNGRHEGLNNRRFRLLRGFASRDQGVSGMILGCVTPSCTGICWVWSPRGR